MHAQAQAQQWLMHDWLICTSPGGDPSLARTVELTWSFTSIDCWGSSGLQTALSLCEAFTLSSKAGAYVVDALLGPHDNCRPYNALAHVAQAQTTVHRPV